MFGDEIGEEIVSILDKKTNQLTLIEMKINLSSGNIRLLLEVL